MDVHLTPQKTQQTYVVTLTNLASMLTQCVALVELLLVREDPEQMYQAFQRVLLKLKMEQLLTSSTSWEILTLTNTSKVNGVETSVPVTHLFKISTATVASGTIHTQTNAESMTMMTSQLRITAVLVKEEPGTLQCGLKSTSSKFHTTSILTLPIRTESSLLIKQSSLGASTSTKLLTIDTQKTTMTTGMMLMMARAGSRTITVWSPMRRKVIFTSLLKATTTEWFQQPAQYTKCHLTTGKSKRTE